MLRIWKAQVFMGLVDDYGDVPYSEAGKLLATLFSIRNMMMMQPFMMICIKKSKKAMAALNPGGDFVSADLFYGANAQASVKTANATDQVAKWKKLGNSLLLRLGMRYSRVNAAKAQSYCS